MFEIIENISKFNSHCKVFLENVKENWAIQQLKINAE